MEDKRTAIAIFLCFIVILVYSELVIAPQMRARNTPAAQQASIEAAQPNPAQMVPATGAATSAESVSTAVVPQGHPTVEVLDTFPTTVVQTPETTISISHLGVRFRSIKLTKFKEHLGKEDPLDLVYHAEQALLPGGIYVGTLTDERVSYKLTQVSAGAVTTNGTYMVPAGGELVLTYTGELSPDGPSITKTLKFGPQPYVIAEQIALSKPVSDVSRIWLEWALHLNETLSRNKSNPNGFITLTSENKIEHVPVTDVTGSAVDHGANKWVGVTDRYFMAALVPPLGEKNTRLGKEGEVYYARVSGDTQKGDFTLFVGPKQPDVLEAVGFELKRSVDLGMFSPIAYPLLALIRFFHSIFGNYGLAIILLTLAIKSLFLPLTKASFTSMRKMQEIAPEMKELRERIKDPTELNKAVLNLYKQKGVNPMGGCLPMLIQLPVFLGLYNALLNSIELRHAPFALWIQDLSATEALYVLGIPIPVMVLIMGASMYYQQATSPQTGDPQQQKVMKMMPFIFTIMFIIFPMPSGLVLYWLVNNTISIIQQVYLRSDKKASPYTATAVASLCIFAIGYVLTLI